MLFYSADTRKFKFLYFNKAHSQDGTGLLRNGLKVRILQMSLSLVVLKEQGTFNALALHHIPLSFQKSHYHHTKIELKPAN